MMLILAMILPFGFMINATYTDALMYFGNTVLSKTLRPDPSFKSFDRTPRQTQRIVNC